MLHRQNLRFFFRYSPSEIFVHKDQNVLFFMFVFYIYCKYLTTMILRLSGRQSSIGSMAPG